MNKCCHNPDCLRHGDTPRSEALRGAKGRVAANAELMTIVRVIAGNADAAMQESVDSQDMHQKEMQLAMIRGELDQHPAIQGVMNAFALLLQGHRPTQEFYAHTLEMPEGQGFLATSEKEAFNAAMGDMPPVIRQILSFDDFMAMLKGLR